VLHALEQLDDSQADAVRLLRIALASKEWQLCQDILRFLRSIDDSGAALRVAVKQAGIIEELELDGEDVKEHD
jgi:RAB6A-GEF complex partner protein 1